MRPILGIRLISQLDASAARQRARQIAGLCGFGSIVQTRLSTTVSALARAAVDKQQPGQITFALDGVAGEQTLVITVSAPVVGTAEHPSADSAAVLAAARRFIDRIESDPATRKLVLYKSCLTGGSFLDPDKIARTVMGLAALPGDAALTEAQRRYSDLATSNVSVLARNGQLQMQADALLSADRRKDEFLAILAHELRGPLAAVAMAGDLLQKNPSGADRVISAGQLIVRQTAHMSRLIEDLLDVSRIGRNELSIERLPVDLCDAVRTAVEQIMPAALRRRHELVMQLPAAPVIVQGDRTRLIQVLGNLIGNAIRYTPDGGRIEVALESDVLEVRVCVSDNGVGIAPENLPRLFDLFVQAHRSSGKRDGGLGLGLALVKALMHAHGGDVHAHSDGCGQGSRFEISFPKMPAA